MHLYCFLISSRVCKIVIINIVIIIHIFTSYNLGGTSRTEGFFYHVRTPIQNWWIFFVLQGWSSVFWIAGDTLSLNLLVFTFFFGGDTWGMVKVYCCIIIVVSLYITLSTKMFNSAHPFSANGLCLILGLIHLGCSVVVKVVLNSKMPRTWWI